MDVKVIPDSIDMNNSLLRLMRGVNDQAFNVFGSRVCGGPFAGMHIPSQTPWDDGNSSTKLIGCYEEELHPSIEYVFWRSPKVVVNVGCAEGYYAIGFARNKMLVYAFDIDEDSLVVCSEYAEKNNVQLNIQVGVKEPEELRLPNVLGHRLYFMDCEGAETELIDLDRCPEFRNADIIVECHDFLKVDASRIVADKLYATHKVELVRPMLPHLEKFSFLRKFPTILSVLMVVEKRPMPFYWLTCWANQRGAENG